MSKPDWFNTHTTLDTIRENTATLRPSLVKLCDGNYCAAMILDEIYYHSAAQYVIKNGNDHEITTDIPRFIDMMVGMFDEQAITDALTLIADKGYMQFEITNQYVTYEFYHEIIDDDLEILIKGNTPPVYTSTEITSAQEEIPDESQDLSKSPQRRERRKVEYHNNRASRVGLLATLTILQWLETLDHFQWHCAFCSDSKYRVLEHFVPLIHGGGTTEYNCVPACAQCNRTKHDTHPSMIPTNSTIYPALQRVQEYLDSRRMNVEAEQ